MNLDDAPAKRRSLSMLPSRHRRWLVIDQMLLPALLNLVLNGGIAWLIFRGHETLLLWGESGVGIDLMITGFLLPFAICLINSTLIRRQVEAGKPAALEAGRSPLGLARSSSLWRALVLGSAGLGLGSLPLLGVVALLEPLSVPGFVGLKGAWAGLLAAAISPVVAWWALVGASVPLAAAACDAASADRPREETRQ